MDFWMMKKETRIFYFSIILLTVVAYFIQTNTFFSPDVGYLLHAANQILAGGKYGSDIFETNPPMILYLYLPACLLAKWMAISIITAVRLYVISLALVSLSLCCFLLKKIILPKDKIIFYFLFYTLLFGMLLFPVFDFAQREHILIILMMPYLLSAALALENKFVHPSMAILIGVLAGFGFALKPFFLVTPCLVELYIMMKQRRWFAWFRIEPIMIISVLLLYLISIFLLQPDYINVVLPLVLRYYFPGTALPWYKIIVLPNVLFCVGIAMSYFIYRKYDRYSNLGWIIELALLGMIVAFLIPRTLWCYHVIPALFLSFLLIAHFLSQSLSSNFRFSDSIILLISLIIILLLPVTYYYITIKYVHQFQYRQSARQTIADYLNKDSGSHSIACIGLGTQVCFPLVLYTHGHYAERFPSLWWYPGLRKLEKNTHPSALLKKDKLFLINSFAEDLNRYKARWIIVDMPHFKKIETPSFDIVKYLLENKKFKSAWQHYRYVVTIQSIQIYIRT
jgi:hypothetical protein